MDMTSFLIGAMAGVGVIGCLFVIGLVWFGSGWGN